MRVVFRQVPGTMRLVWEADRKGALLVGALTLVLALLPAGIAWAGKLIVDGVVAAARSGLAEDRERVLWLVAIELLLMSAQMAAGRLLALRRELLRGALGNRINERILEKALELELRHFEDAEVYDKMQNARREASSRPLSLVMQAFAIGQNAVTLAALSGLLLRLSPVERPRHRRRVRARVHRRGAALRRVVPAVDVARAGRAAAQLPRVDPHARQPREGGEALRARAARARRATGRCS